MTRILLFDTETTGLPKNDLCHFSETDNFPRLVQLSYLLYDHLGNLLNEGNYLVKPLGFEIPQEATEIHGISTIEARISGSPLGFVLGEFLSAVIQADYIVAHNMKFDFNIVGAEAVRTGFERQYNSLFSTREKICTMEETTELVGLRKGKGFKYPRLSELHYHLFNTTFANAHNAYNDVQALSRCFFKLRELGLINIHADELYFAS